MVVATIKNHIVDHNMNDDIFAHQEPNRIDYILIIATQAINPPDNKNTIFSKNIEEPLTARPAFWLCHGA